MTAETTHAVTRGFAGDPAEAFAPPASAGGCCGTAATATAEPMAGMCCGTVAEARAAGGCCGDEAKARAVAAGAGCCG